MVPNFLSDKLTVVVHKRSAQVTLISLFGEDPGAVHVEVEVPPGGTG